MSERMKLSDEEWKKRLTPEQFEVMRRAGTERAFTGEYNNNYEPGIYHCAGCDAPLYESKTKYDSGSGWPSFWAPIHEDAVRYEEDRSLGMVRTEVLCARCDSHLGHVFPDGPQPTGIRHCINSVALRHEKVDE